MLPTNIFSYLTIKLGRTPTEEEVQDALFENLVSQPLESCKGRSKEWFEKEIKRMEALLEEQKIRHQK